MAKRLRETPPSSSVARLFDVEAAARAVAARPVQLPGEANAPTEPPVKQVQFTRQPAQPMGQRANVKRQIILSHATDETFSRLVDMYRRATGTRLTDSHVARAIFKGVAHCMDTLERETRSIGPQKLPSNARGQEQNRERFENLLADAFVAGIRAAAAFDHD